MRGGGRKEKGRERMERRGRGVGGGRGGRWRGWDGGERANGCRRWECGGGGRGIREGGREETPEVGGNKWRRKRGAQGGTAEREGDNVTRSRRGRARVGWRGGGRAGGAGRGGGGRVRTTRHPGTREPAREEEDEEASGAKTVAGRQEKLRGEGVAFKFTFRGRLQLIRMPRARRSGVTGKRGSGEHQKNRRPTPKPRNRLTQSKLTV